MVTDQVYWPGHWAGSESTGHHSLNLAGRVVLWPGGDSPSRKLGLSGLSGADTECSSAWLRDLNTASFPVPLCHHHLPVVSVQDLPDMVPTSLPSHPPQVERLKLVGDPWAITSHKCVGVVRILESPILFSYVTLPDKD